LCLLDLFYKWKSGSMVDIRNRQAMSRMLLENRWFETEPLQRYSSGAEWNGSPIFRRFITEGKTGIFM